MNIIDELKWRGAIHQQTDESGLYQLTNEKTISLYCGLDPSGDSMHIGHLIPFMVLKRFQLAGHQPVIVMGGATGTIGDPSGRLSERTLQSREQIQKNVEALTLQLNTLFDPENNPSVRMLNNEDWTQPLNVIPFLRDYGKHFGLNAMLAKDIVATRLGTGISFTEFTYQILQALDFHHLFKFENVQLQIGGSDQWGNITSGLDLIRKKEGPEAKAFGLTIPLLLKSDGAKFGKTAGEAIWLDPKKTTPYEFYQFWLNTDDRDVIKFLKYFTFLTKKEIKNLEKKVLAEPHKREAQHTLAAEVTRFVHKEKALRQAEKITQALFSGKVQDLTAEEIQQGFKNMPTFQTTKQAKKVIDWLVELGIEPSKRQAREDVNNGAFSLNGEKVLDENMQVTLEHSIDKKYRIVRLGKKRYYLVEIV